MKYRAAMLAHCEGARAVAGAITITVVNFTFGLVIEEQASPPLTHMHLSEEFPATDNRFPALAAAMAAWREGKMICSSTRACAQKRHPLA